jgi:hypothetical protein
MEDYLLKNINSGRKSSALSVHSEEFKTVFVEALQENNAAIFAGAGLSRASGFADWKELLRDIAHYVGLNIDKESDLVAVAQYYCNSKRGRGSINQKLINEFYNRGAKSNENIRIIARLPIGTIWTTNYDKLIEDELHARGKTVDVKVVQENLATTIANRDVVVYKMHGDISDPAKAVITKDDYEAYTLTRQLFATALQGDLVSKTFLFLGFSFSDPNLNYILARIRILLSANQRQHFCVFKTVDRVDFENDEDYSYEIAKRNHGRQIRERCVRRSRMRPRATQ